MDGEAVASQVVSHPAPATDEGARRRTVGDVDQDALAALDRPAFASRSFPVPVRRRGRGAAGFGVAQVDLVGRLSHRQLSQRRECRLLEEALHRPLDLLRRIDDAALEAIEEGARRQVDQDDLFGLLHDPVRYRLADLDARDLQ